MTDGGMTVTATTCEYPAHGLPALAVRVGRALESWGRRAGRAPSREEGVLALRVARAAAEARAERDRALRAIDR
ncbi:MAG: hypothetical protein J0G30_10950 [Actinomycetales bacterium]|nr:hypothetical protein [Actinomycetales bacterium]